ncbi:MAG: hypothetical protein LBB07_02455, partial [Bifidobacteriaceae bacterium]|nr:hypothetical protein [Bifidobacteriaceae bacterium]
AFILSEDQVGSTQFWGSGQNWFEKNNGASKSTIAQAGESFSTAAGNFTSAEQSAILEKQLNGVCTGGLSGYGCADYTSYGSDTTVGSYKFYPLSIGDLAYTTNSSPRECSSGKFFTSDINCIVVNSKIQTLDSAEYWLRSPERDDTRVNLSVNNATGKIGNRNFSYINLAYRPSAQIDLNKVILTENLVNNPSKGGEVSLENRWSGAANGDKKMVLLDENLVPSIEIKDKGENILHSGDTVYAAALSELVFSRTGGTASDKLGFKIVDAAGKVLESGESDAANPNMLTAQMKNNFWNNSSSSFFPKGANYKLYLYRLKANSAASDLASAPLELNLSILNDPRLTLSPDFVSDHIGANFSVEGFNFTPYSSAELKGMNLRFPNSLASSEYVTADSQGHFLVSGILTESATNQTKVEYNDPYTGAISSHYFKILPDPGFYDSSKILIHPGLTTTLGGAGGFIPSSYLNWTGVQNVNDECKAADSNGNVGNAKLCEISFPNVDVTTSGAIKVEDISQSVNHNYALRDYTIYVPKNVSITPAGGKKNETKQISLTGEDFLPNSDLYWTGCGGSKNSLPMALFDTNGNAIRTNSNGEIINTNHLGEIKINISNCPRAGSNEIYITDSQVRINDNVKNFSLISYFASDSQINEIASKKEDHINSQFTFSGSAFAPSSGTYTIDSSSNVSCISVCTLAIEQSGQWSSNPVIRTANAGLAWVQLVDSFGDIWKYDFEVLPAPSIYPSATSGPAGAKIQIASGQNFIKGAALHWSGNTDKYVKSSECSFADSDGHINPSCEIEISNQATGSVNINVSDSASAQTQYNTAGFIFAIGSGRITSDTSEEHIGGIVIFNGYDFQKGLSNQTIQASGLYFQNNPAMNSINTNTDSITGNWSLNPLQAKTSEAGPASLAFYDGILSYNHTLLVKSKPIVNFNF